jgi:HSP20 family protein
MKQSVERKENQAQTNNGSARQQWITPEVDIVEEADRYLLRAEMPGVGKEGLEISLENNELTIIGRRTVRPEPGEVLYRESRAQDYRRVFEMDPSLDQEKIKARIEQGVLTLELPKAEKVKPRKIQID